MKSDLHICNMQIWACAKSTKVNRKTDAAFHDTWIWPIMKKEMQKGRKGGCTAQGAVP